MMNVKLLRKIQKHILEEPRRLVMNHWLISDSLRLARIAREHVPPCGTAACIGGWACELSGTKTLAIKRAATDLLEITPEQANRLFETYEWPNYSGSMAEFDQMPPAERAKIAAERIEHFIKTKGKE